jgi:hypothetical protein
VKRKIAMLLAGLSGIYLLVAIPTPDPLPFIDEAAALLIFVRSMAFIGYDVRRWLPFLGSAGRRRGGRGQRPERGPVIDVDD